MSLYDIRFIDRADNTYLIERAHCLNDTSAIALAEGRDTPSFGDGFEIWNGLRLVFRASGKIHKAQ